MLIGADRLPTPEEHERLALWAEVCRARLSEDEHDSEFTEGLAEWRLDPVNLKGVWSPTVFSMLGVDRSEQAAFPLYRSLVHEEDLELLDSGLAELFHNRPAYLEHRIVRPDGEVRWLAVSARPLGLTEAGTPRWFVGTVQDITQRRELKAELQNYRTLFETLNSLACIIGPGGELLMANPQWEKTLGFSLEHLKSEPVRSFLHPDEQARALDLADQVQGGGALHNTEGRWRTRAGGYRWLSWSGIVLKNHFYGVGIDVTERRQQEQLYRSLARNLPQGAVVIFDPDYKTVLVEGPELGPLGLEPSWALGQPVHRLFGLEELGPACRAALAGQFVTLECELQANLYRVNVQPVRSQDFEVFAGMILLENVTERRRQSRLLEQTQESAWVGGWEYDCQTGQLYWTRVTFEIHELSPVDFQPDLNRVHEMYPAELREAFEKCRSQGQPFKLEVPLSTARCRQLWVRVIGKPIWRDGRVVRVFGSVQDITGERWILSTLQKVHLRNQALLKAIPDLLLVVDEHGVFQDYKPPTGFPMVEPPEVFLGESITRVLPEIAERTLRAIEECREGELPSFEYNLPGDLGRHFEARVLPASTEPRNFLIVIRDITERHRTLLELQASREAALEASRVKSQFLANMSHEIRTPMNGVLGMTELALRTELTDEQREYLEAARESGKALLAIIDDILDISKIEAGRLELEAIGFSLRQLVGETLRSLGFRAHEKGLELLGRIEPTVPDRVLGDPVRFRQLLINLVGNAIKFTQKGEVELRIEPAATARVLVSVTDSGPGIAPERQKVIFDPFTQGDGSTTRQFGGTGLGLAISRQLVARMGGQLEVESELGRGSRFYFTIDLPPEGAGMAALEAGELRGLHALVVDDNPGSQRLLRELLASWQMTCDLRSSTDNVSPTGYALALVDHSLDGALELARRLTYPVVLMVPLGESRPETRQRVVGKPLTSSELLDAIHDVIGQHLPLPAPTPAKAVEKTGSRLRVLLAEDNLINAKVVKRMVEGGGHEVWHVENGERVLEALGKDVFDLVLMDVQMPRLDGFETTRQLRERGFRVPVVALTANAMAGDRERCLEAGMDGYLAKPVDRTSLLDTLERFGRAQ